MHLSRPSALISALAMSACVSADGPSPEGADGPGLTVTVAPLDLPGIDLACYDLRVDNAAGQLVIARGDPALRLDAGDEDTLCSTRFGNGPGGAISYVAPCDASQAQHTVTLWVDGLYSGTSTAPTLLDYQDPCPSGCQLTAECRENADTPVNFNLTIMRPASQGFFDVAVSFDSIFCAAKLDCEDDAGEDLELLHNPDSRERDSTIVLGLACTAGPGGGGTVMLRDAITLTCGQDTFTLDPAIPEGNAYSAGSPPPSGSPVWQYAVYAGQEDLPCGAESCEKVYWNIAIGMDLSTPDCTLTTTATAGTPSSLPAHSTPEATTWPLITWDLPITLEGGGRACSRHPLNGTEPGVSTDYTGLDEPAEFDARFDGFNFELPPPIYTLPTTDLVLRLDGGVATSYPGSGETWFDMTPFSNDAQLVGGVDWLATPPQTMRFNLTSTYQYAQVPDSPSLRITGANGGITLSLWIRSSKVGNQGLIAKSFSNEIYFGGPTVKVYELGIFSSELWFQLGNGTNNCFLKLPSAPFTDGRWRHVVATWDGTSASDGAKIYRDGALVASGACPIGTIQTTSHALNIAGSSIYRFAGSMGEILIYNRALSPSEVEATFMVGQNRFN